MSDTPRTAAFIKAHHETWPRWEWDSHASAYAEWAEELERENAELRERLEILSKSNEKQTEEYICVDREYGLWKRAAIDAARKEQL